MELGTWNDSADAVIIGTGAFGLSAAYHLARLGCGRVLAVDQFSLASQASPRAAGLFKRIQPDETRTRLAQLSIEIVLRFPEETGAPLPVVRSGSLMLGVSPEYGEFVRTEYARSRDWGVELELLSLEDARRTASYLEGPEARAVCYTPGDVYIEEPKDLLDAYAEAARRLGVVLLPDTPVTGVRCRERAVESVVTMRGEIRTPLVVDAAGAWARAVGEMSGATVPVQPVRHQLFITEPTPGIAPENPILRIIDHAVYVRPARAGLMLGAFERDPLPMDVRDRDLQFSTDDVPLDESVLRRTAEAVEPQVPGLRDASLSELRGGLFTMTPDGTFICGPDPNVRGFWTLTGCNGSGFSFSPALGQMLAEWIVDGEPSIDISSLRPARYPAMPPDDEMLRLGVWQYEHYYEP